VLSRRNLADASRHSTPNPRRFNHLQPLCPLFPTPILCFQQLAASFPKTPGVGVCTHASLLESATCRLFSASAQRPLRLPVRQSGLSVMLGQRICLAKARSNTETTAALTTFRINTCKSVSKQSTLTTFRMNTYRKRGEGGTPIPVSLSPRYDSIALRCFRQSCARCVSRSRTRESPCRNRGGYERRGCPQLDRRLALPALGCAWPGAGRLL